MPALVASFFMRRKSATSCAMKLQQPTFEEAERRCSLYCVLCTKRHGLMRRLLEVFGRAGVSVRYHPPEQVSHPRRVSLGAPACRHMQFRTNAGANAARL